MKKEDVTLNQRVLQRFFAYFVLDFYSKYFKLIKPTENENMYNQEEEENIYIKSNQLKNGGDKKKQNLKNSKFTKKNSKSVSLIANYTERYMNLKERVKPIIGTNYIQFYDPITTKISRMQILLEKDKHGYNVFPDGCRHILVENKLFK